MTGTVEWDRVRPHRAFLERLSIAIDQHEGGARGRPVDLRDEPSGSPPLTCRFDDCEGTCEHCVALIGALWNRWAVDR